MSSPCPLFVEAPSGLAAVSIALQSSTAKPPMARMGSKTRYAHAILRRMGLQPGQRADRYIWCDADDGVRALLQSLGRPQTLNQAVASLRSFERQTVDERKVLWRQLKAQGPLRSQALGLEGHELARWMRICTANRLINVNSETWRNTGRGGSTFGGAEFCTPAARVADSLQDLAGLFESGGMTRRAYAATGAAMAAVESLINTHALEGARVLIDPPYRNTSPYQHVYGRREVVDDAVYWETICGPSAVIAVCEAEPVAELVRLGWHAVEITGSRAGGSRHFSAQKREWLTMSVPPFGALRLFR